MSDTPTQPAPPGRPAQPLDLAAVLAAMQDQLDDLAATVEAQQRTIDALVAGQRAAGVERSGNGRAGSSGPARR